MPAVDSSIRIRDATLRVSNLETRLPFRFGVVEMTSVPHGIMKVDAVVNGVGTTGWAADHFPPKWLTKSASLSLTEEAKLIRDVVDHACRCAKGVQGATVFDCWRNVYRAQRMWGEENALPALLWSFGASFVERALIDAYCRAASVSFDDAVRRGRLGFRPASVYPELEDGAMTDALPEQPSSSVEIRHTVGHGAPLTASDVDGADRRPDDDLPVTLEETIRVYGIQRFKIKMTGDARDDAAWLREVLEVLHQTAPTDFAFTLDANEQYTSVLELKALLNRLHRDPFASDLQGRLLFIEQPFAREDSFSDSTAHALRTWTEAPPLIVDEADEHLDSCGRALDAGYVGTSHKNCKGVFKSLANACLLAHRSRIHSRNDYILSAEDLTTIGPISLQQDLAVTATLGIQHAERNGHHFFRGLSSFDEGVQSAVVRRHPDLFTRDENGTVRVSIREGHASLQSVVEAPFGHRLAQAMHKGFAPLTPAHEWSPSSPS